MTEKLLSGFILVTMTLLSMPARSAEYEYEKPEDYETVTKDPLRFTEIGENVAEQAGGAALHNTADYVSIINKTFQNNRAETVVGEEYEGYGYTLLGGAVYNDGDIDRIKADFVANSVAADGADGLNAGGGALYNGHNGKITDVSGDFISNSASGTTGKAVGGAVFNQGKIEKINGNFVDNRADVGGAVFNDYEAEIGSIGGSFVNNSGGALYNLGKMGDVRADFVGNSGNAVYNGNRIGNIRGNFSGNRLTDTELNGGIVFNSGSVKSITGNFSGNEVSGNSVYGIKGGAVYNYQGTIGNIKAVSTTTVFWPNMRLTAVPCSMTGTAKSAILPVILAAIRFNPAAVPFTAAPFTMTTEPSSAIFAAILFLTAFFPKATAGRKLRAGPFSTITIHPSAAFSAALSTTALKPLPLTVWLWAVPFIPIRT